MTSDAQRVDELRSVALHWLQECSGASSHELERSPDLVADGLLNSLSLAHLVIQLEQRLNVSLLDDLRLQEWKTLDSVVEVLMRSDSGAHVSIENCDPQ